jgi:hypothetical protein
MRNIGTTDTAKLIRAQLKAKFPGIKFSVRSSSYSGGSSIRVNWENGPTQKSVEEIIGAYAGSRFDGMIDMAYHVTSFLYPDGSVSFGNSPGTGGSRGSDPGYTNELPAGAEEVSFSVSYVFANRDLTKGARLAIAQEVKEQYGEDIPEIDEYGEFRFASSRFHYFFHQVAQDFAL